jgi:hypothetical protein
MADSNSLINIGELSKPANTLVEKISDAIGGVFRPYQIRRLAQAQAEADKIQAVSQIEINELQLRALHRFFAEEAKRQTNIETITKKALPGVCQDATPQNIQDDWITNFFDKCRLISDDEMQNLWAKVLAGEANAPGKYSKRTVNLLAGLDKSDAELFGRLCSFAFTFGTNNGLTPLIYDTGHRIYNQDGLSFVSLSHLESIGLIHFDPLSGYRRLGLNESGIVFYYEIPVWIGFAKPKDNEMNIGHVLLTKVGKELALICGAKKREGFLEYVKDKWKAFGYKIHQNDPQRVGPNEGPATSTETPEPSSIPPSVS